MKRRVLKKRLRRAERERARRLIPDPGRHDWAMEPIRFKRELRAFIARMEVSKEFLVVPASATVTIVDVSPV